MPLTWIVEFSKDSRTGGLLCQPLPFCQSINSPSSMYTWLIFKPDHFPRTIGTSELVCLAKSDELYTADLGLAVASSASL